MSSETLPQKRRYKKPDAPAEMGSSEEQDSEIIVLSSLLQNLLARKQSGEPSTAEAETRTKINRFVSRGNAGPTPTVPPAASPAAAEPAEAPAPDAPPAPPKVDPGGPEAMAAIAFPKFEPRSYEAEPPSWERTGSTWGRGVLYFAFAAALALGAFLVGRTEAPRPPAANGTKTTDPGPMAVWTPDLTAQLDKALAADHAGDLTGALRQTDELRRTLRFNPVLEAYASTLHTRLGHTNDVEADLARQIAPNTPPESALLFNAAQGFNYARRRDFDQAANCFAAIAAIDPLDTANLAHWAEALRRKGQFADAIGKFQQAITRLPVAPPATTGQREFLAFHQRLTQVENGKDADFKTELDAHLAVPNPSGYTLLTAAAVALQKGEMTAAVDDLKKAQAVLSPENFDALVGDYFFRAYAYRAEMAPFLPPASPGREQARRLRMDYFIDP